MIEKIEEMAARVYATLRGGYSESVYEEALGVEFRAAGIEYSVQHTAEVFYRGQKVGEQELDFAVMAADLVVELKAVASISKGHLAQLRAYMRTIGKTSGVVINFPPDDQDAPQIQHVTLGD